MDIQQLGEPAPTTAAAEPPAPTGRPAVPRRERTATFLTRYGTLTALVLIVALFSVIAPNFLSAHNLTNVLVQISTLMVVAAGLTVAVAAGEFDLSVGATAGLAGVVVTGLLVNVTGNVVLAILAGMVAGAAIGALNGFLVAVVGLPSLIATLGMISVVTGVNLWYTRGRAIYGGLPEWFAFLGRGSMFGIPVLIILMLLVVAVVYVLLERTASGRHLYTIGANRDVARLAGIAVRRNRFFATVFSGVCAAVAGIALASRLGSGQPEAGDHFLMSGLAAVFLGMTAFTLGRANIKGTVVGTLIIGVLSNGLNLLGLPFFIQDIAMGAVMIGAVTLAAFKGHIRMPDVSAIFRS